jgi:Uma2 family endonuclease
MTTIQADMQALRQAIKLLSRREREELAEWILNSPDIEFGVAETALPYGGRRYYTVEEYLRFEDESSERHEYVAGYIFAMSPPLIRHEMITTNLLVHFQNQLRGTPCRAFTSNTKLRLRVAQDDVFYMPDVLVACGPFTEEVQDAKWLTDPCVVIEVLSPSTEAIDRREKALNYRHIPSLEEYILIAQRSMEVTVFRRSDNWRPLVLTAPEDVFESRAIEVNIALANIYEGVR